MEFDEQKLIEMHDKTTAEAEDLLRDEDKMEKFLQKLERKMKVVPVAGNSLAYIPLMVSLVRNYVKKEYTELPLTTIISILVALIYWVSPVDIIPDFIPVAGYTDDALVIAGCLSLVRTDLEDYRQWRKEQGLEFDDLPDYEEIDRQAKGNMKILDAFFKGKKATK